MSAESAYTTSKAASRELVDFILGGSDLNYVGHRACVRQASLAARCENMHVELAELSRKMELAGGHGINHLHRTTRNGAWISAVPHRLNSTELSQEEFWDNICFRYGLMPQDIPATYNSCGKKFLIEHSLSCPKGGLVLARHDDAAKEWGALGSRDLVPSAITYKPKINSRTVHGENTGTGARQESGTADGGTDTVEEAHGGIVRTVNG